MYPYGKTYRFFKDTPVIPSYPMAVADPRMLQTGFSTYPVSRYQTPMVSSIQFYDPITGNIGPKIDPAQTNPFVNNDVFSKSSFTYTKDDVNVDIVGSDRNVATVKRLLEIASLNPALSATSADSMTAPSKEYYDIDAPVPTLVQATAETPSSIPSVAPWSVVPNPRLAGKMILTTPISGMYFSGSGILLLEASKLDSGQLNLTALLFKSSRNGTYEELGGEIDSKSFSGDKTLQTNAKKEGSEESMMLFDFGAINLDRSAMGVNLFVDIKDNNGMYYRCYLVCLDKTYSSLESSYQMNRRNVAALTTDSAFTETDAVNRFYLTNLRDCLNRATPTEDNLQCKDWLNNSVVIRGRTKKILKELMMNPTLLRALVANQSTTTVTKQGFVGTLTTISIS